jgi:hypothetical protein
VKLGYVIKVPICLKVPESFDAGVMDSDLISVELEVAPSVLCAYGSLLRNFQGLSFKLSLYLKIEFHLYAFH